MFTMFTMLTIQQKGTHTITTDEVADALGSAWIDLDKVCSLDREVRAHVCRTLGIEADELEEVLEQHRQEILDLCT